jgi:hypothetical protein
MLRDGFNSQNVFTAIDNEAATTNIVINNSQSASNTWLGGTLGLSTTGINAVAGQGNEVINTMFNGATTNVSGTVGLWLKTPTFNNVTAPAFPASGSTVTNTSGQTAMVMINGGAVSYIAKNGSGISSAIVGTYTVILEPGNTINMTYTGSPAWTWWPIR